jgi:hypothetical protein
LGEAAGGVILNRAFFDLFKIPQQMHQASLLGFRWGLVIGGIEVRYQGPFVGRPKDGFGDFSASGAVDVADGCYSVREVPQPARFAVDVPAGFVAMDEL